MRGPVTSPVIEAEYGISGVNVRGLVNWMRRQGDPTISKVASDERGYWWATTWDDAVPTMHHLEQRAQSLWSVRAGMARAFGHNPGQGELL